MMISLVLFLLALLGSQAILSSAEPLGTESPRTLQKTTQSSLDPVDPLDPVTQALHVSLSVEYSAVPLNLSCHLIFSMSAAQQAAEFSKNLYPAREFLRFSSSGVDSYSLALTTVNPPYPYPIISYWDIAFGNGEGSFSAENPPPFNSALLTLVPTGSAGHARIGWTNSSDIPSAQWLERPGFFVEMFVPYGGPHYPAIAQNSSAFDFLHFVPEFDCSCLDWREQSRALIESMEFHKQVQYKYDLIGVNILSIPSCVKRYHFSFDTGHDLSPGGSFTIAQILNNRGYPDNKISVQIPSKAGESFDSPSFDFPVFPTFAFNVDFSLVEMSIDRLEMIDFLLVRSIDDESLRISPAGELCWEEVRKSYNSSNPHLALIIGCSVGALAIFILIGLILYKRRQSRLSRRSPLDGQYFDLPDHDRLTVNA